MLGAFWTSPISSYVTLLSKWTPIADRLHYLRLSYAVHIAKNPNNPLRRRILESTTDWGLQNPFNKRLRVSNPRGVNSPLPVNTSLSNYKTVTNYTTFRHSGRLPSLNHNFRTTHISSRMRVNHHRESTLQWRHQSMFFNFHFQLTAAQRVDWRIIHYPWSPQPHHQFARIPLRPLHGHHECAASLQGIVYSQSTRSSHPRTITATSASGQKIHFYY